MRFVIIGAGRVGLRTARVLRDEDHEVTMVERDEPTRRRAREQGFTVVDGDGSREDVLEAAGIADADALGALTGDLNVNFTACMIGNHHGCRTVMRIDEAYREGIYRKYADQVDEVIYPERLGAIGAKNALLGGTIRAIADVAPHLQVVELTLTADAPVNGYTISELHLPADATVLAFGKGDGPLEIPTEDLSLEADDRLVVLADFDVLSEVRQLLVGETAERATANAGTGTSSAATELLEGDTDGGDN
ncbi:TrkA-N domain-containing protein [Natrinema pellirubrum DSM 15624]|uniref:K+ transport system, NAD-binding component n=1 Tax=Natrinema pellirubrum (strain DSM 15624 / CIP 106293 / JCM 10476 / NCIMB 786 / 157) TaxID=797303 RepID=L0JNU4_NATP1|nr:TrkA family potassium uptake protein [Natrinema pellirubrum]AGB32914.1 K+ transport system, NAD-binding component [Natrinema pellirubrum DSM 15624]ELY75297.1 TrkA-N domain-containing protein [Natrinema pellirubrum DSM 15624]